MIHVYELFGDNPIVDVLMLETDRQTPLRSVRASMPLLRAPFIEAEHADGTLDVHQFARDGFASQWAETRLLFTLLAGMEIQTDFNPGTLEREEQRRTEILRIREQSIEASRPLFEQGLYEEFVGYYGPDCKHLPREAAEMLEEARRRLADRRSPDSRDAGSGGCR